MQLDLENNENPNAIKKHEPGTVTIGDKTYKSSLLVTANSLDIWSSPNLENLDLTLLTKQNPDVILLGTGETMRFLSAQQLSTLQAQGIGVEVMTTAAACRTFNVLLSESRNVLAALII